VAFLICALIGYILGSIPTSYMAGRMAAGIDLREHGSGNLGATNTFRILGARVAVVVLVVDVAKGFLPVYLSPHLPGAPEFPAHWLKLVAAFSAVLGHMFSVFLRFSGGKGIATTAGAYMALSPYAFAFALLVWLAVLAVGRIVSVASMVAALTLPFLVLLTWRLDLSPVQPSVLVVSAALSVVIIAKHRSNIRRLMSGEEPKLARRRETP